MKTVNILGTDYAIVEQAAEDNPKLDDANGLCEIYSKEIILDSEMIKPCKMLVKQPELYKAKVLRHKIVHAFFFESGLIGYCENEILVDYLAAQIPKMAKVMQETGCL